MKYRPRNDFVVLRFRDLGKSQGGVAIPEKSREGKEWRVVAIGPLVEDLEIDDRVEAMGEIGQDIAKLPNCKDLFVTKQSNILLIVEEEE